MSDIQRFATLDAAMASLGGTCTMAADLEAAAILGAGGTAPELVCGKPREVIRMLDSEDGKLFVLELCGAHDRALMRMLRGVLPVTYEATKETGFSSIDELAQFIENARATAGN